ncbi:hypothetical protein BH23CHL8_BH23CHL8_30570 [soil metagenome]
MAVAPDWPHMRAVIATFETKDWARSYVASLRCDLDVSAQGQTVAAYGEAHDGHPLVVAWVPDDREVEARALVREAGGIIHEASLGADPSRV